MDLDYFRQQVRETGAQASPFRVACAVGEAGAEVPCPYAPGTKWAKAWQSGLARGRELAAERKIMATSTMP